MSGYMCVGVTDHEGRLLRDLHLDYFDDYEGLVDITVPSGYKSNMEIYSNFFLKVFPPNQYLKMLIVYEYICTHPHYVRKLGFTFYKEEADQLFVDGLIALGAPKWKRILCYALLRCNDDAWKRHRKG